MATNFNELSGLKQWAAVLAGAALITAALYYVVFKNRATTTRRAEHAVQDKVRENNELESYRPKLKDMERQLANLKQQLEIERRIVPDERERVRHLHRDDGRRSTESRRGSATLCGPAGQYQGILQRGPVRDGVGWSLLFDAEFL